MKLALALVAQGVNRHAAAMRAGVSPSHLYATLAKQRRKQ
jgi:hypothetical protein